MADINSSLPIRSEVDPDQLVRIRIVDGIDTTKIATVDADKNVKVGVYGDKASDGSDRALRVSELGHATLDGVYHGTDNTDPSQVGLVAHVRGASPGDAEQTIRVTGISAGTRHALDIALLHHDGLPISESHPLAVVMAESEGVEVQDFNESAGNINLNASDTHVYTVPVGKIFKFDQVCATASGFAKFEIETSQDGTAFTKLAVLFNSTANPNVCMDLKRIVSIPAGGKVRVTRTNKDKQAMAMYSTIVGLLL